MEEECENEKKKKEEEEEEDKEIELREMKWERTSGRILQHDKLYKNNIYIHTHE